MRRKISLFFLTLSITLSVLGLFVSSECLVTQSPGQNNVNYKEIIDSINLSSINSHLEYLTSLGSRVTGTPMCEAAVQYIYNKFVEYGLNNVSFHEYPAVTITDYGANFELVGRPEKFSIYGLKPNLVVPVTTPGITAPLLYARDGQLSNLDGLQIEESICLMEFNTGSRWLDLVKFGAKAVIFIEPESSTEPEENAKSIDLPLYFPRYYMPREDANSLLSILNSAEEPVYARVSSKMVWEQKEGSNVMGMIRGTQNPNQIILLSSYYDSYSIAPSLSPGANEACGVATLLELARFFSNPSYKPKYTIMFVAFSGHQQKGLGAYWFVRDYIKQKLGLGGSIILNVNLQLSTYSNVWVTQESYSLASLSSSAYASFHRYVKDKVSTISETLQKSYSMVTGEVSQVVSNAFPGDILDVDSHLIRACGGPSISYVTTNQLLEKTHYHQSLFDSYDKLNLTNLKTQLETIFPVIYSLAVFDNLPNLVAPMSGWTNRIFGVNGTVAVYNTTKAWWDPLPDAIVTVRLTVGTPITGLMWITMSDEIGSFFSPAEGLTDHVTGYEVLAFKLDPTTGKITHAPDFGLHAFAPANPHVPYGEAKDIGFYTLFKCSSVVLFDITDPDLKPTQISFQVLDHYTVTTPESYGIVHQVNQIAAVLFILPNETVDILLKAPYLGNIPLGVLVNATEEQPEGTGYTFDAEEQYVLTKTAFQIAQNMYYLSGTYIQKLEDEGVGGELPKNMTEVAGLLAKAEKAATENRYSDLDSDSLQAWGLVLSAYVKTLTSIIDIGNSVVFLGLIVVPFVVLFEMLFLSRKGRERIVSLLAVYALIVLVFSLIHPGFRMAANGLMAVMGLSSILLVLPLAGMLISYFSSFVSHMAIKVKGVHFAEMSRWIALMLSFSLGVENLKRRKLRSALMLTTVTISVIALTMFSSISALTVFKPITISQKPSYQGIYVRPYEWLDFLPLRTNDLTRSLCGYEAVIAPRSWLYTRLQASTEVNYNMSYRTKEVKFYAALGMSPNDPLFDSKPHILIKGRWFLQTDELSCIINDYQALKLGITEPSAKILAFGKTFQVVGIVNYTIFDIEARDVDGENPTPLDVRIPMQNTIHASIYECIIIPYQTSLLLGAQTSSIAIAFNNPSEIPKVALNLFTFLKSFPIYVLLGDKAYVYSTEHTLVLFGLQMQIVPLILAALTILNVMIGSVMERKREIFTFASVGLSPLHVSSMFMAESMTYATIGIFMGYGIAIFLCRNVSLILREGVFLNFSSSWVVTIIGIIFLIIAGSNAYPMFLASRMVTPSLERKWVPPTKPKGNQWAVPLPFVTSSENETRGVCAYINEYLKTYIGLAETTEISIEEMSQKEGETEGRQYVSISMRMRLPPYEKGIRQNASITMIEDPETKRWVAEMAMYRISGNQPDWARANRDLIDRVRKQFLLWRSLKPSERQSYIRTAED